MKRRRRPSTGGGRSRCSKTFWDRLRHELEKAGKERQFERLKVFLTGETPSVGYAEIGSQLETSEGAVKVAVHRLRRRFRTLLQDEIAQTVSSPDEVDEEMRHLWNAVGR